MGTRGSQIILDPRGKWTRVFVNSRRQKFDTKSNMTVCATQPRRDPLSIVVIVEDLRLPLDEGAKKTCFNFIQSLKDEGASVLVFTQDKNPLLGDALHLPRNKFLISYSLGRHLMSLSPDVILYMPESSGT